MDNTTLYESSSVWAQELQAGQRNLLKAVIDFFPDNINHALDVGCGDGKITQELIAATGLTIEGIDVSHEALDKCSFQTFHGYAESLPFPDSSYDLVLSTDVLEHLPNAVEQKAWQEIFRVAQKAVIIAVPFRENLLDAMAYCAGCRQPYHVNWHLRSYDYKELLSRVPKEWLISHIVLTGEPWPAYHPQETAFRRYGLNEYSGWEESFCPHCNKPGSSQVIHPLPEHFVTSLGECVYAELASSPLMRSHSELLLICRKKNIAYHMPQIKASQIQATTASNITIHSATNYHNLIPYPETARKVRGVDNQFIIQLPVYRAHTHMLLDVKQHKNSTTLIKKIETKFKMVDGQGQIRIKEIKACKDKENSFYLYFNRPISPGYYGFLVYMPGDEYFIEISFENDPLGSWLFNPTPGLEPAYLNISSNPCQTFMQITEPLWYRENAYAQYAEKEFNWPLFVKSLNRKLQGSNI